MTDTSTNAVSRYAVESGVPMPTNVARGGGELTLVAAVSTGGLQPSVPRPATGRPFQPGQSGNPAGRKPGSRNKITELFIAAMRDDFAAHGAEAIAALRTSDPAAYLAAIRSMIPPNLISEHETKPATVDFDAMSDAEFADAFDSEGSLYEQTASKDRRNRAVGMVASGEAPTVRDALLHLGSDL